MQSIVNLFLSAVDLAESEGRTLKTVLIRIAICIAGLVVGTVFVLGGYGFLMAGIYLALQHPLGPALAALLTGLASIVLGGGIALLGYELVVRK